MANSERSPRGSVVDGGDVFSPEDKEELARQNVVLQNTFKYICKDLPIVKIPRLAIVEELRNLAEEIREGGKTIDDFWAYQEKHISDSDHQFLSEIHPGLNVVGWKVILAFIDPLTYGRDIIAMSRPYQPIRKT